MSKKEFPYARMSPITVMEDFPIGTIVNQYFVRERDTEPKVEKVEGYLFDGRYWFPAYDTWDGWYPYYGDDVHKVYDPQTNEESQALEDWLAAIKEEEKEEQ
jgi:hypothetical protein